MKYAKISCFRQNMLFSLKYPIKRQKCLFSFYLNKKTLPVKYLYFIINEQMRHQLHNVFDKK